MVSLLRVRMQPRPQNAVTIAVSSRALFRMDEEQRIYTEQGVEAYVRYQLEHENEPFGPGPAFPFVKVRASLHTTASVGASVRRAPVVWVEEEGGLSGCMQPGSAGGRTFPGGQKGLPLVNCLHAAGPLLLASLRPWPPRVGHGFQKVSSASQALEAVNRRLRELYPDSEDLFDIVLMTNNHAQVGVRLINSINHYGECQGFHARTPYHMAPGRAPNPAEGTPCPVLGCNLALHTDLPDL